MKNQDKVRFFGLTGLGVLPFVAGVLFAILSCTGPDFDGEPHLTNQELLANFRVHRDQFERLRAMIASDKGLTRVDTDWTEPGDPATIGVPPERVAEYREIFQSLGIARGYSASSDGRQIELITSAQGWVAHGSAKGYLYCTACPPSDGSLTPIEGNWYIFFYKD